MKQTYRATFLFLAMSISLNGWAQDVNFSQFYEMPLLRNPALAGIFLGDVRFATAYRNQWQSVTVPYQTMALSGEFRFSSCRSTSNVYKTVGLLVTKDQAGDSKLKKIQVMPALNLHIPMNEEKNAFLAAGFIGGAVQHSFDPTNLYFDDQFVNGSYSASNATRQVLKTSSITYWDISGGASYNSDIGSDSRYYIGLGIFHASNPTVAFLKQADSKKNIHLPQKLVLNFGLSTSTSDFDKFIIYGDYFRQGGNALFQGGFLYSHDFDQIDLDRDEKKTFTTGLFYRWNDAVIPVIKLEWPKFSVGVSYDINISKLAVASQSRGGTEITLCYKNFLNICNSALERVGCPSL